MSKKITSTLKKAILVLTVSVTAINLTYIPSAASPIQSHSGIDKIKVLR